MEASEQQLEALNGIIETKNKIEALREENAALKEKLRANLQTIDDLHKLDLAAASLITSSIDATSLKCLSKLDQSATVVPNRSKDEDSNNDQSKMIIGKFLNHLLTMVADFAQQNKDNCNIFTIYELEKKLTQMFQFAEDKELIPETEENEGWKKNNAVHEQFFNQIKSLLETEQ